MELNRVRWGLADILLVYLGIFLLSFLAGIVGIRLGFDPDSFDFFGGAFLVQFAITVVLVWPFAVVVNRAGLADLGLRKAGGRNLFHYGFLGGLGILLLVILTGLPIEHLQPDLQPQVFETMLRGAPDLSAIILLTIMGVVLAPLSEELFYRGMVYPVFRKYWGPGWGAVAAGLIFGLAHWDLWRALPLSIGGALLCYLYERTDSILVPMVAHGVWNSAMVLLIISGAA